MNDLADGCFCGHCDSSCYAAIFRPCCGACMVGSSHDPDGDYFRYAVAMHDADIDREAS